MGRLSVNERLTQQNTSLLIWLTACLRKLPDHQCKLHKDELARYVDEFAKQNEGEYVSAKQEGDYLTLCLQEVPKIVTPEGTPAFQDAPLVKP